MRKAWKMNASRKSSPGPTSALLVLGISRHIKQQKEFAWRKREASIQITNTRKHKEFAWRYKEQAGTCSTMMIKTAWLRLLVSFMRVAPVALS